MSNVFYTTLREGSPEQDGTSYGDCVSAVFFPTVSIYRQVHDYRGRAYYIIGELDNLQRSYTYTGVPISLVFEVREYNGRNDGKLFSRDVEYTVTVTDASDNVVDDQNIVEPGTYTLTISGRADAGYHGKITETFTVVAPDGTNQSTSSSSWQSAYGTNTGRQSSGYGSYATPTSGTTGTAGSTTGTWKRYGGTDRYETMSAIVSAGFTESDWAVLATGTSFPDALTASSIAGAHDCPVLLTDGQTLSSQAHHQLERLGVRDVCIVGGEASVSASVEAELTTMGIAVHRMAGADRVATSVAAFKETRATDASSNTVVIATGDGFADALSIGSWCYATRTPIVLVRNGVLSEEAVSAIKADGGISRVVIVGGTAVVSDDVMAQLGKGFEYVRLAGADRYETSAAIASWAAANGLSNTKVCVATGATFPDALAGAALAGKKGAIVLLDNGAGSAKRWLTDKAGTLTDAFVLGGEAAISADVMAALQ